jgi:hypothetical protein
MTNSDPSEPAYLPPNRAERRRADHAVPRPDRVTGPPEIAGRADHGMVIRLAVSRDCPKK